MAALQELAVLLRNLTQQASALSHTESLEDYQKHAKEMCQGYSLTVQQLAGVRAQLQSLDSASWQQLSDDGVAMADATKTLNALMRYGTVVQACVAAALYSWLLRAPGAPVHNMLDTLTFSGCLQRLKETAFASSSAKPGKGKAGASQQQSQAQQQDDDDDGDDEAAPAPARAAAVSASAADLELSLCLCVEALTNLAAMAQQVQLRGSQEVLQAALEGCSDLLCCSKTAKVPAGSKGLGLSAGSISAAAYCLLEGLFSPRHGSMEDMAAVVLPRLTPLMVGTVAGGGKRTASESAAARTAAVTFVRSAYSRHPEILDAVAALARHVCLKAPDKADCRAAAVKAASELLADLPQWEQEQFTGFVYNLSRTPKLGLRTLSVGLANNLLMNLPEPFKRSTFAAAAAQAAAAEDEAAEAEQATAAATTEAGGLVATPAPTRRPGSAAAASAPTGMVVAPWSVVALAALLQRCSDKSAVVRARALSDLAEVVDCFASLLAEHPGSEQHQVAEAFVEGLGAAAALQVPEKRQAAAASQGKKKKKAGAGRAGEDSEEDDEPEDEQDEQQSPGATEGAAAAAAGADADDDAGMAEEAEEEQGRSSQRRQQRRQAAGFVAYMPSQLSVDLAPVTSLVHRRCGDAKAAVRRGALQLLEALLVMRASWQGYVRQLPGSADLALLEAATADPLVSVRKAALVALSTLLELFPCEPSLSQAWVASGLPLVRDVEASIQDCLADWVAALLLDKAAAAGTATTAANKKAGKKAAAAAVAADDAEGMDWQGPEAAEGEEAAAAAEGGAVAAAAFAELRQLLAAVAAVGRAAGACLGKLAAAMAAKKKLKAAAVARGLEAVIAGTPTGSSAALGAYILLKEIAAQEPAAPSWQFLQQRWAAVRASAAAAASASSAGAAGSQASQGAAAGSAARLAEEAAALLLVISETAAGFPADQAQALAAELLQHTLSFQLPPAAAGAHVAALFRLTEAAAGSAGDGRSSSSSSTAAGAAGPPAQWAKQVFAAAHEQLRRYIDACSAAGAAPASPQADHSACVALFTLGDVALLKAAKPPSGLLVLLQAFTAHKFIQSGAQNTYYSQAGSQACLSQQQPEGAAAAVDADDAGAADAAGLPATQGTGGGRLVPACVQAHAWIALGKVCLVDEALAKKCVPLFVQELGRSSSPVVRNNILVALSDMLIQYTALVDAHMPRLAACIRDRHELVRRQALALLANLLMKDYVKWRGPLFHRFTLALVDPSPAVRQLAEYLLRDTLATKAPLLAYNHFVEALFVLNGCTAGLHGARLGANLAGAGGSGSAAAASDAGGAAAAGKQGQHEEGAAGGGEEGEELSEAWMAAPVQFTLKGKHNRAPRDLIYASLLRSMSPEHKFSSAAKLCGEVLAGVADGLLPLAECEEVLRDALSLLASKDIKVSASRLAASDEEEMTQPSQAAGGGSATAAEAAARARGKLVSALMKRHLVEQVVPVLVELRRLLAELKHPLLVELMGCFAALLKEYKSEVEDILVADKQLAKEILYDIKQAEQAKQQQQQQAAAAAAAARGTAARAADAAAAAAAALEAGSPPPAGVMPGTPVAAEVLATAERQRRQQLQQLRQQQQAAAAAGDMPAPSPRPPPGHRTPGSAGAAAALQTPATAAGTASRSRLASSSSAARQLQPAAGSFETPAAKTPASAAAAAASAGARVSGAGIGAGFKTVVASPAPLTVAKRGTRAGRRTKGAAAAAAADENAESGGGAGHCPPSVSKAASQLLQRTSPSDAATNVLLPSPYSKDAARQWNIPQHVATGEKQQQRRARAGQQAAAAAAEGDAVPSAGAKAGRGGRAAKGSASQAAADDAVAAKAAGAGKRATRGRGATAAAAAVKEEPAAEAEAAGGGRRGAATRKRRNA
ncbi:hypothetical protein OEZ86_012141 [Tetradesmus obliquus]|nr:hypothetical protein OEZ86_012141 [Tetradesmus obliquus]